MGARSPRLTAILTGYTSPQQDSQLLISILRALSPYGISSCRSICPFSARSVRRRSWIATEKADEQQRQQTFIQHLRADKLPNLRRVLINDPSDVLRMALHRLGYPAQRGLPLEAAIEPDYLRVL
jgi:hypothetical protein